MPGRARSARPPLDNGSTAGIGRKRGTSRGDSGGLDDAGLTLRHEDEITGYERQRPEYLPSVAQSDPGHFDTWCNV